jgi:hypothetical protein
LDGRHGIHSTRCGLTDFPDEFVHPDFAVTEYKPTLFDRHGPDAGHILQAWGYGLLIFGLTTGTLLARIGFRWWVLPVGAGFGALGGGAGWLFGKVIGDGWKKVAVDGSSTPYTNQFSYEQSLVMAGRIDDALASFESAILAEPTAVAPRMKAAELYARAKSNPQRAAALFREIIQSPTATNGETVYATNRLVDLLIGPLNDPGRAMVELRRLIDARPSSDAADHARRSLAELKSRPRADAPDGASVKNSATSRSSGS